MALPANLRYFDGRLQIQDDTEFTWTEIEVVLNPDTFVITKYTCYFCGEHYIGIHVDWMSGRTWDNGEEVIEE